MKIPTGSFGGATAKPDLTVTRQPYATGNALKRLGNTGAAMADAAHRQKLKDDQLLITEGLNQLDAYQTQLFNDPDTGLYAQKGLAATNATERYRANYDDIASNIAGNMPDDVRREFINQVDSRRIQFTRSGLQYESQQKEIATKQADKARLDNSIKKSALYYNDPTNLALEIGSQIQLIKDNGAAEGKSAEIIQDEIEQYTTTAYQSASQNMASQNPETFLEGTGGSEKNLFDAVFMQESGGHQTDAAGNPLTSSKGAIGIAQVMPDTAQEMARLSGLEWSDERYKHDAQYNAALGKMYLEKQLTDFGGNQILALAAYNAGPAQVNKWIAKNGDPRLGEISMDEFVSKIPYKETRDYVTNIANKMNIEGAGYAPFYQLEPKEQVKLRNYAQGLVDQNRAHYRDYLDKITKDAVTAYMQGEDFPAPPTQQDFVNAYGTGKGLYLYQEFNKTKTMGSDISVLQRMPYYEQVKYIAARKPVPGTDYAQDTERYKSLVNAFTTMNKQRNDDPIQYAIQHKQASEIDFTTPDGLEKTISARASQAANVSGSYNVKLKLFTEAEASSLTKLLLKSPTSEKLSYLHAMQQGISNNAIYNAGLRQISSGAPGIAVAGLIMNKSGAIEGVTSYDTAALVLEGNMARAGLMEDGTKTKGLFMPKDKELRTAFSNYVGNLYAGDPAGASQAYETALDYYAGACARKGIIDGSFQSDIFTQAVRATGGEVVDHNDQGNIALPWGMKSDEFDNHLSVAWQEQVIGRGIQAGNFSLYGLQNNGDSQYLVKAGTGYLVDPKTGDPVRINMEPYSYKSVMSDIPK